MTHHKRTDYPHTASFVKKWTIQNEKPAGALLTKRPKTTIVHSPITHDALRFTLYALLDYALLDYASRITHQGVSHVR